jgi:tRNA-dihydrouridine synthase 2
VRLESPARLPGRACQVRGYVAHKARSYRWPRRRGDYRPCKNFALLTKQFPTARKRLLESLFIKCVSLVTERSSFIDTLIVKCWPEGRQVCALPLVLFKLQISESVQFLASFLLPMDTAAPPIADTAGCGGIAECGVRKHSGVRKPNYTNILALAPMVRCGTLPLRLLALRHGADLLWSEELIAWKLSKCVRHVNDASGLVYFCNPPRSANGAPEQDAPVYVTCPEEKGRNILQLGAADGPSAVAAGLVVGDDVAGLDVNMGCPKPFSLQGGMGSALLKDIERASDIVKSLDRNFGAHIGVTCKIRLLPTLHDTIHFVNAMVLSGAQAVTVHARLVGERPVDFAHWDALGPLVDSVPSHIPIIANGDVFTKADVDALQTGSKISSVMIARGALANASIFESCKTGLPPLQPFELISEYLAISADVENRYPNSKYTVQTMVKEAGYVSEEAMFR